MFSRAINNRAALISECDKVHVHVYVYRTGSLLRNNRILLGVIHSFTSVVQMDRDESRAELNPTTRVYTENPPRKNIGN